MKRNQGVFFDNPNDGQSKQKRPKLDSVNKQPEQDNPEAESANSLLDYLAELASKEPKLPKNEDSISVERLVESEEETEKEEEAIETAESSGVIEVEATDDRMEIEGAEEIEGVSEEKEIHHEEKNSSKDPEQLTAISVISNSDLLLLALDVILDKWKEKFLDKKRNVLQEVIHPILIKNFLFKVQQKITEEFVVQEESLSDSDFLEKLSKTISNLYLSNYLSICSKDKFFYHGVYRCVYKITERGNRKIEELKVSCQKSYEKFEAYFSRYCEENKFEILKERYDETEFIIIDFISRLPEEIKFRNFNQVYEIFLKDHKKNNSNLNIEIKYTQLTGKIKRLEKDGMILTSQNKQKYNPVASHEIEFKWGQIISQELISLLLENKVGREVYTDIEEKKPERTFEQLTASLFLENSDLFLLALEIILNQWKEEIRDKNGNILNDTIHHVVVKKFLFDAQKREVPDGFLAQKEISDASVSSKLNGAFSKLISQQYVSIRSNHVVYQGSPHSVYQITEKGKEKIEGLKAKDDFLTIYKKVEEAFSVYYQKRKPTLLEERYDPLTWEILEFIESLSKEKKFRNIPDICNVFLEYRGKNNPDSKIEVSEKKLDGRLRNLEKWKIIVIDQHDQHNSKISHNIRISWHQNVSKELKEHISWRVKKRTEISREQVSRQALLESNFSLTKEAEFNQAETSSAEPVDENRKFNDPSVF